MRLALFASGAGSNVGAILQARRAGTLRGVEVPLVVCDRPRAGVVQVARAWDVPCRVRAPRAYRDRADYEASILEDLRAAEVDHLALAGYMRIVGPTLLTPFAGRIVNVHPSLLPAFPGKHAVREALAYGVKVTGASVHFVDEGVDTGPIIAQRTTPVHDDDTLETLRARIQAAEHELYPRVLQWLADGRVVLDGRHVRTPDA